VVIAHDEISENILDASPGKIADEGVFVDIHIVIPG
jgi:hypothetical protein